MAWPDKIKDQEKILKVIPWDEVLDLADELMDGGMDKDEALDEIASILDTIIPADALVPGPGGALLEIVDGTIIRAALGVVVAFATDPVRRAARKARRAERKAERKARRAARKDKKKND